MAAFKQCDGCARAVSWNDSQERRTWLELHWDVLEEFEVYGKPHLRMKADLAYYPPCVTPEAGFTALSRKAA